MLQILSITAPIYLIIAVGFGAVRLNLFSKLEMRTFGRFVVQFCLPALIFQALSQHPVREVLNWPYLAAYALGTLVVMGLGLLYARKLCRSSIAMAAMQGLGMSSSNSSFIGYPILLQLIGPAAGIALALTMVVENLMTIPLGLALAESDGSTQRWHQTVLRSMRALLSNPMILAILVGFLFSFLQISLPEVLAQTVKIVATAASPIALFVIGGSLVGLRLDGVRQDLSAVAIGKLILHPIAVFFALLILPPLEPSLRIAAVVFAGMPMLSMYPVLAQKYHLEGFCAAALLVTTVASFVSISALLWVLHNLAGWIA